MAILFVLTLLITFQLTPSISYANTEQRPFWTEQSSYTLGNTLYTIGVSTHSPSVEAGRQAAFTNGLAEIRNYAQVENLDGLLVETQMTFAEPQGDGTVSIWRLLRVPLDALREVKMRQRGIEVASSRQSTTRADKQQDQSVTVAKPEPPARVVRLASNASETCSKPNPSNVKVNLPDAPSVADIPPHVTHVIKGWSRVSAGQLAIDAEDRRDWQIPLVKSSELSYRK